MFALFHEELVMFPFFLVFGLVAGSLRVRSQSLIPSILLHAVWNLMFCLLFAARGTL